jgi:response regulator RpfG family c-di-GMP phosphodiesterase
MAVTETAEKSSNTRGGESKEREDPLLQIIRFLVGFIESKDPYRGGHSQRVYQYALKIAEGLGLMGREELKELAYTCYLHDLGRIFIHRHVWNKPEGLTQEEYELVKQHPVLGETVLLTLPGFIKAAKFVRHHHEREDGFGYPDNLPGNALPLINKIVSVANAYDAMTSARPFRPSFSPDIALEELKRCSGLDFNAEILKQYGFSFKTEMRFDPQIVTAFCKNGKDLNQCKEVIAIPKKKIMVVDDDDLTCWSLASLITKEGYEAATAEDGIKALEVLKNNKFDLVITDLKMPNMNGLELMEEVMEMSPGTPVIIMTCYSFPEIAQKAKQKGAFDFVEKPLRQEMLRNVIQKALAA